jgi:hypothetical protein
MADYRPQYSWAAPRFVSQGTNTPSAVVHLEQLEIAVDAEAGSGATDGPATATISGTTFIKRCDFVYRRGILFNRPIPRKL